MANKGKGSAESGGPGRIFYSVLALLVLGGAVALWMGRDGGGSAADSGGQPAPVSASEADPSSGVAMGPSDAPVTIAEFADYQCPHCAQFQSFTGRLAKQNFVNEKGVVRWVHFDFPLGSFPNSIPAAVAARCAGNQGSFWEMHNWLLANQSAWGRENDPSGVFVGQAESMGLDADQFEACVDEQRPLERIRASRAYGERVGVSATPTIFVNGEKLPGVPNYETLAKVIRDELDSAGVQTSGSGTGTSGGGTGGS